MKLLSWSRGATVIAACTTLVTARVPPLGRRRRRIPRPLPEGGLGRGLSATPPCRAAVKAFLLEPAGLPPGPVRERHPEARAVRMSRLVRGKPDGPAPQRGRRRTLPVDARPLQVDAPDERRARPFPDHDRLAGGIPQCGDRVPAGAPRDDPVLVPALRNPHALCLETGGDALPGGRLNGCRSAARLWPAGAPEQRGRQCERDREPSRSHPHPVRAWRTCGRR